MSDIVLVFVMVMVIFVGVMWCSAILQYKKYQIDKNKRLEKEFKEFHGMYLYAMKRQSIKPVDNVTLNQMKSEVHNYLMLLYKRDQQEG